MAQTITQPTKTIRASVLYGAKDLRLEDRQLPSPSPDEVQVAVKHTTLCGSDLHYYKHFANGDMKVQEPMALGHECAGEIVAVGSGVPASLFKVGDLVALEVAIPCGEETCEYCAAGRYNICPGVRCRASAKSMPHFQGTLQERINHPYRWTHKLPAGAKTEMGALLEPLAVALHAVQRGNLPEKKCRLLVLGAGAVGLLVARSLLLKGHSVTIADISAERVEFATTHDIAHNGVVFPLLSSKDVDEKQVVAQNYKRLVCRSPPPSQAEQNGHASDVGTKEELFDRVFECTGVEGCVQTAIYASKPGGRIVLVGMGQPIQTLNISAAALREVDIVGTFRYANNYPEGIDMLASGQLAELEKLITHRFSGVESVPQACEMACRTTDDKGNLVLKVIVEF